MLYSMCLVEKHCFGYALILCCSVRMNVVQGTGVQMEAGHLIRATKLLVLC